MDNKHPDKTSQAVPVRSVNNAIEDEEVKHVYGDKEAVVAETAAEDILITPGQEPVLLEPEAPDGGYGWVIIFAVFMIHLIVDGVSYSFGVLFPQLLDLFGGTKSDTSWTISILIGTTYGCGPLPSFLAIRLGRRTVAFIGALIAFCGALLSCFATATWHLTLTFGFITGLGFGFLYLPAVVSVATWFKKRRALAVGIAVCGTGFGTIVMAPLSNYLLEEYSLWGCLLLYAGIILNCCIFAALLRPTPGEVIAAKRGARKSKPVAVEQKELDNLLHQNNSANAQTNRRRNRIAQMLDMDLMRQWRFWVYCLTAFFGGISSYIPYTYLPHRAEVEAEILKHDAAKLISYIGFANLVGRLTSSAISDRPFVNRMILYSVFCLIAGAATSLSVLCNTYYLFVFYSIVYGFSGGFIIALQSVVLTDIVGLEKLTAAFGILLFIEGAAVFVGPPMAGSITDAHGGNYTVAFIVFGILMAMAGLSLLVIPVTNAITGNRKTRTPTSSITA
ncbi:monocarboxylate transporter 3-like [Paramacrobiotus metropolitanus]|uniref:monocarboxylate transporter 3-like n=1 Tax=Paramacrobiotus metropolitanus TaxID=2943436 RepID=UPI0024458257|nr:monocarboxylate transporter 3-like [Paramacrobiotus metropolitanus]